VNAAPSVEADDALERAAYAKVSWRLLPMLFLCYVLAYLDRVNVGFAKLQMLADLEWSDAVFAAGAGIFFIGYFLFEVPSNLILRRVGARLWIARIMVTWGIISACTLFVRSELVFYAMRLLLGLAEAGFFPGIILYLTYWYPSRLRARKTAWFMLAIAVTGVIGNPVSGWIMEALSGRCGLAGWQWLFLMEGVPSIVAGVGVYLYLDSGIDEARWLTAGEKALLKRNLASDDRHKSHASLADAFRSGRVWLLSAVYFCLMIGLYGVGFWLPTIVHRLGVQGYLRIGLTSAIPYGAAAVGMIILSRRSDLTGERRWHTALTSFAGGSGLILCGLTADNPPLSIACLSLGTLGILASLPLFWTLPTGFLAQAAAAAGIGIVNSVGNLGGFVGPNITTWIRSAWPDPSAPLYVIGAVLFLAGLMVLVLVPRPPALAAVPAADLAVADPPSPNDQ